MGFHHRNAEALFLFASAGIVLAVAVPAYQAAVRARALQPNPIEGFERAYLVGQSLLIGIGGLVAFFAIVSLVLWAIERLFIRHNPPKDPR
jgi:hypothetical protein